ncbi:hypothetical protein MTO96_008654 [Rhipicephalus appendiculatus]
MRVGPEKPTRDSRGRHCRARDTGTRAGLANSARSAAIPKPRTGKIFGCGGRHWLPTLSKFAAASRCPPLKSNAMFRRKKDTTETQKAKESKEAKDAREKKKLALFLTPKPPTPPLKKRSGKQPLKQGNAVLPRTAQQGYDPDSDSSSDTSSGSSDTSSSGSSSDGSSSPVPVTGVQPRSPRVGTAAAPKVQPQAARKSGDCVRTFESRPAGVSFKQGSQETKRKKKQNVSDPPSHQRKSSRKEKADRSSTESDEECNLATPFIWTMGMVQKLVQFCSEPPPPPPR